MKYAIVIMDGAAGLPCEELGGLTTLEAAQTPNLDKLVAGGTVGLTRNVPEGLECSSNVACTSVMGFDPAKYPIGRGAIEGLAAGVNLGENEVALRVNLCSVIDGKMSSYSADNISTEEAAHYIELLASKLNDDTFTIYPSVGFRAILVVKNHPELMDCVFYAAHNISDMEIQDYLPKGKSSDLILDYQNKASQILTSMDENVSRAKNGLLPVNCAWIFWPGLKPSSMETFYQAYGLNATMQSGVDLLKGLAVLTDVKVMEFEGITDGADTDYRAQGLGALEMLKVSDVAFVHIEAPDAQGHDGHAHGKMEAIEAIDREIISRLVDYKDDELRIMVLPDHPTPVVTKRHSSDMVPFVLHGPGFSSNNCTKLTEKQAESTGLIVDPGYHLMKKLLSHDG